MVARVIDFLFAAIFLVLFSPIILVTAGAIWVDSGRPILYTPTMIGYQGRPFHLYRFRTMAPVQRVQQQPGKKLTKVGHFTRNYSLDHLPVLFNLFNGTLTLMGPRPMEPEVVDLKDQLWQRYFSIKPGLINYAVLKLGKTWTPSRSTNPERNQDLELEYIQQKSLYFISACS